MLGLSVPFCDGSRPSFCVQLLLKATRVRSLSLICIVSLALRNWYSYFLVREIVEADRLPLLAASTVRVIVRFAGW